MTALTTDANKAEAMQLPPWRERIATQLARFTWGALMVRTMAPALGLALFILFWSALSHFRKELPGPAVTWDSARELFAHPFYVNGPNDQGIGWNILYSLRRVGAAQRVGVREGPWGRFLGGTARQRPEEGARAQRPATHGSLPG